MHDVIVTSKELAIGGMEEFLKTFSFVPETRLHWTPTQTAKSAIRIAAHTALYASKFARMIGSRQLPRIENLDEMWAEQIAKEVAITDRKEIETIFRVGTGEVIAALDLLPLEALELSLESGFGWSMPMIALMNMPGIHAHAHAGQIDFLQTCWDDQEVHF